MSHISQRERERRPARRSQKKDVNPRILIVCEGVNTERQYFEGYLQHCENPLVDIEIAKEQGVPKTLVRIAKRKKEQAAKQARRFEDVNLKYEQVWCVFDVDDHLLIPEAIEMASKNHIETAISNPCFEIWLLLHFRDSPGMHHRHKIQDLMKGFVDDYDKNVEFGYYAAGVKDAISRASKLQAGADESGEGWRRNPTSGVFRLARVIGNVTTST